jgi:hypothetical protein
MMVLEYSPPTRAAVGVMAVIQKGDLAIIAAFPALMQRLCEAWPN